MSQDLSGNRVFLEESTYDELWEERKLQQNKRLNWEAASSRGTCAKGTLDYGSLFKSEESPSTLKLR